MSAHERLVVALAREVAEGDTVVVGIGTPLALAAVLLARELRGGRVGVLLPGARNPRARDVADYLVTPWTAGGGGTRLSRTDILDEIAAGRVTLQFVRPAQVDRRLRINTERVGARHLVGPVALPDVLERIGRVVAYLPRHDPATLVSEVDAVTAPRPEGSRGLARVVTPLATLERAGDEVTVTARAAGIPPGELADRTGFPLRQDRARPRPEPTAAELDLLRRVVDPAGLAGVEDPAGRPAAVAALTAAWRATIQEAR